MSYFCIKAITINKQAKTYKARGGDNNVVPRMDYWTNEYPLEHLLPEVASGCAQFTTRSDKHIAIEAIVRRYDQELTALFGYGAYELWSMITGSFDPDKLAESKAFYLEPGKWSGTYGQEQAKMIDDKVALWRDSGKMGQLRAIVQHFCIEVANLKIDTTLHIIRRRWDGSDVYVARVNRYSLSLTHRENQAVRMSRLKAENVVANYKAGIYEIVKVPKLIIAK